MREVQRLLGLLGEEGPGRLAAGDAAQGPADGLAQLLGRGFLRRTTVNTAGLAGAAGSARDTLTASANTASHQSAQKHPHAAPA